MRSSITLRYYQQEAVDAVNAAIEAEKPNHPLVVLPTGSGKTVIFTHLIDGWRRKNSKARVLVLAHVRELLLQAHEKISRLRPAKEIGMYSASLKRREWERPITIAGIQSVWMQGCSVRFDYVIVDEAHLIPIGREQSMYREFLGDLVRRNRGIRIVGFTATPWRLDGGHIAGKGRVLTNVAYQGDVTRLIQEGYLATPRSKATDEKLDVADVEILGGDFNQKQLREKIDREQVVSSAVSEIVRRGQNRKKWLIFCCGIAHAQHVASELAKHGITAEVPHGGLMPDERKNLLGRFLAGDFRAAVNVDIWSTGLDVPEIDLIALLRPTASLSRYIQMIGRGFRLADGKKDFLVLDFARNIERHGPVNLPNVPAVKSTVINRPRGVQLKVCPNCHEIVPVGVTACPDCGHDFSGLKPKHDATPSEAPILSGQYFNPLPRLGHAAEPIDEDAFIGEVVVAALNGLIDIKEYSDLPIFEKIRSQFEEQASESKVRGRKLRCMDRRGRFA